MRISDSVKPELALACAIIERAVLDWKTVAPASPAYRDLISFFNGDWCQFLWETVMDSPVDVMLNELKVPKRLYVL